MPKIKVMSENRTQQVNVITKARNWGAEARDGDYGPVAGKNAVVVNTRLGSSSPALQLSRGDFMPSDGYDKVIAYKDFMNLTVSPWGSVGSTRSTSGSAEREPEVRVETRIVHIPVEIPVGPCAQSTLKILSAEVLTLNAVIWKSQGLPYLEDKVELEEVDGRFYILDVEANEAKELTAALASQYGKDELLEDGGVFADYLREFHLLNSVVMGKPSAVVGDIETAQAPFKGLIA